MSVDTTKAGDGKSTPITNVADQSHLIEMTSAGRPRKAPRVEAGNRTKTDTGRRDEKSKALGRTLVKELCKMAP
jgi:hypothetical protein